MDVQFKKSQQNETQAGIFLPRQFFFLFFLLQRAGLVWNRKPDPLIISKHSGTAFFMLFDILIWDKIMEAIRSSARLSNCAHNPFVACLHSALKTSTLLLVCSWVCPHHHRCLEKSKKPVNHMWKESYNFLCACCVCVNKVINVYVINLKTGTLFYSIWTLRAWIESLIFWLFNNLLFVII